MKSLLMMKINAKRKRSEIPSDGVTKYLEAGDEELREVVKYEDREKTPKVIVG